MNIQSKIEDAIADVRFEPDALEEIAEEHGVNADVLRARIDKMYGSVDALAGRVNAQAKREAEEAEAREARLPAAIAALESQFIVTSDHPHKGTRFVFEGEQYVFVLLSSSHPTYYARCIKVSTGKPVGFNKAAYNKIIAPTFRIKQAEAA